VNLAERNTKRLLKLVMDLGQMDRMESGQLELQLEQVSIDSIVTQSLESVKVFAEQQDVNLKAELIAKEVYADGDRVIQVLVNLLSNAVKFSPKGGTVTVYADYDDNCVQFKVADQGRGIPAEFCSAVFERYKQVEVADATKKGGSGLGLPICKLIVEQHGGAIGVESEVGKGSTFWFRLPLKSA
jgi:signal transduction histidine kinase